MGHLLNRQAVLTQLGISSSTLDRLIARGELTVAKKIDIGRGKLSPRFDPYAVKELAAKRRERVADDIETTPLPVTPAQGRMAPEPPPPTPAPYSPGALMATVKALHASQVAILEVLEPRKGSAIESELWYSLLSLTRTQEHILTEVLIGTPMPQELAPHEPQAMPA
jgi:hypothetical protein